MIVFDTLVFDPLVFDTTPPIDVKLYWVELDSVGTGSDLRAVSAASPSLSAEFQIHETIVRVAAAAQSVATVTCSGNDWVVSQFDGSWANVSTLLHCNGANSTIIFTDVATTPKTYSRVGFPFISTTQKKFGTAALKGGTGSTGYITSQNHADFDFGSGNFTVEFWIYPPSNTSPCYVMGIGSTTASWSMRLYIGATSAASITLMAQVRAATGVPTSYLASFTGATASFFTINTWHHMAIVRSGDQLTMYLDSWQRGTVALPAGYVLDAAATNLTITGNPQSGLSDGITLYGLFVGYIDEVRVTKGVARYTGGSYTMPVAEFPSNTVIVPPVLLAATAQAEASVSITPAYGIAVASAMEAIAEATALVRQGHGLLADLQSISNVVANLEKVGGLASLDSTLYTEAVLTAEIANAVRLASTTTATPLASAGLLRAVLLQATPSVVASVPGNALVSRVEDAYYAYVTTLLMCNDTVGSTTITDTSLTPHTNQWYYYSSMQADGWRASGNGLNIAIIPTANEFDFGSGDFTIECNINVYSSNSRVTGLCYSNGGQYSDNGIGMNSMVIFDLSHNDFVTDVRDMTFSINIGGVMHRFGVNGNPASQGAIAYVISREAGLLSIWSDGVLRSVRYLPGAVQTLTSPQLFIGQANVNPQAVALSAIKDIRITKGAARYSVFSDAAQMGNSWVAVMGNPHRPIALDTNAGDPHWSDVVLLLNPNDRSGSTSFVNEAPNGGFLGAYGSPVISNTRAKLSASSIYFDGSSHLYMEEEAIRNRGTPFTLEFWLYADGLQTINAVLFRNSQVLVRYYSEEAIQFYVGATNYNPITILKNTWHHIAITYVARNYSIFVNGAAPPYSATAESYVGTDRQYYTVLEYQTLFGYAGSPGFVGYVGNLRYTNNVCRYYLSFDHNRVRFAADPVYAGAAVYATTTASALVPQARLAANATTVSTSSSAIEVSDGLTYKKLAASMSLAPVSTAAVATPKRLEAAIVANPIVVGPSLPGSNIEVDVPVVSQASLQGILTTHHRLATSVGDRLRPYVRLLIIPPVVGSSLIDYSPVGSTVFNSGLANAQYLARPGSDCGAVVSSGGTATVSVPAAANLAGGTTPFTVEAWVYFTGTQINILSDYYATTDNATVQVWVTSAGMLYFSYSADLRMIVSPYEYLPFTISTPGVVANRWTHVAVSKKGRYLRLFVDGVLKVDNWTGYPLAMPGGGSYVATWTGGAIGGIRVTTGVVRYWNAFAPEVLSFSPLAYTPQAYATPTLLADLNADPAFGVYLFSSIKAVSSVTPDLQVSTYVQLSNTQHDYLWWRTSLVLDTAGVHGESSILDIGPYAKTATSNNVSSSNVQSIVGSTSYYFTGANSHITYPTSPDFGFGTGPFTVELWVWHSGIDYGAPLFSTWNVTTGATQGVRLNRTYFYCMRNGGEYEYRGFSQPSTLAWHHYALSHDNGEYRLHIDGVLIFYTSRVPVDVGSNNDMRIGNEQTLTSGFQGYITGFRVTKGLCRYRGTFNPLDIDLLPPVPLAYAQATGVVDLETPIGPTYANVYCRAALTAALRTTKPLSADMQSVATVPIVMLWSPPIPIEANAVCASTVTATMTTPESTKTLATAAKVATRLFEDPVFGTTMLGITFDGEQGNTTFIDQSAVPKAITNYGVTTEASDTKFWGAGYFDGNSYLSIAADPVLAYGRSDFSVEFWVKFLSLPAAGHVTYLVSALTPGSVDNNGWGIGVWVNGTTQYFVVHRAYCFSPWYTTSNDVPVPIFNVGQWYHVALSLGNNEALYINGQLKVWGTTNYRYPCTEYAAGGRVGFSGRTGTYPEDKFHGYLDDLRVSRYARYDDAITRPTIVPMQLPRVQGDELVVGLGLLASAVASATVTAYLWIDSATGINLQSTQAARSTATASLYSRQLNYDLRNTRYVSEVYNDQPFLYFRLGDTGSPINLMSGLPGTYTGIASVQSHEVHGPVEGGGYTNFAVSSPLYVSKGSVDTQESYLPTTDVTLEAYIRPGVQDAVLPIVVGKFKVTNPQLPSDMSIAMTFQYETETRGRIGLTTAGLRLDGDPCPYADIGLVLLPYHEWVHVAMVWRIAGDTDLYINGEYILTITMEPKHLYPTPTVNWTIGGSETHNVTGGSAWDGETQFNGDIAEVAVYFEALTASDIKRHYDATLGKGCYSVATLTATPVLVDGPGYVHFAAAAVASPLLAGMASSLSVVTLSNSSGDSYWGGVALLINFETFTGQYVTDMSNTPKSTVVYYGSVASTQSRFGTYALHFDTATYSQFRVTNHPDFNMGSSDFCIDVWAWITSTGPLGGVLFGKLYSPLVANDYSIMVEAGTNRLYVVINNVIRIAASEATQLFNRWMHIALARLGSTFTLYIDGSPAGSATYAPAITNTSLPSIVCGAWSTELNSWLIGWVDELRVTKGASRYSSAFTPEVLGSTGAPTNLAIASAQVVADLFVPKNHLLGCLAFARARGTPALVVPKIMEATMLVAPALAPSLLAHYVLSASAMGSATLVGGFVLRKEFTVAVVALPFCPDIKLGLNVRLSANPQSEATSTALLSRVVRPIPSTTTAVATLSGTFSVRVPLAATLTCRTYTSIGIWYENELSANAYAAAASVSNARCLVRLSTSAEAVAYSESSAIRGQKLAAFGQAVASMPFANVPSSLMLQATAYAISHATARAVNGILGDVSSSAIATATSELQVGKPLAAAISASSELSNSMPTTCSSHSWGSASVEATLAIGKAMASSAQTVDYATSDLVVGKNLSCSAASLQSISIANPKVYCALYANAAGYATVAADPFIRLVSKPSRLPPVSHTSLHLRGTLSVASHVQERTEIALVIAPNQT